MSRQNVEVVRRVHERWAAGDFSVAGDLYTPGFEWQQDRHAVEPGTRRGEEIGHTLHRIFEVYEGFHVEPEEYVDAGDRVVVFGRSVGTARGSGLVANQRFAFVWTVEDGRLARLEVYGDRAEALAAAGLRGDD